MDAAHGFVSLWVFDILLNCKHNHFYQIWILQSNFGEYLQPLKFDCSLNMKLQKILESVTFKTQNFSFNKNGWNENLFYFHTSYRIKTQELLCSTWQVLLYFNNVHTIIRIKNLFYVITYILIDQSRGSQTFCIVLYIKGKPWYA